MFCQINISMHRSLTVQNVSCTCSWIERIRPVLRLRKCGSDLRLLKGETSEALVVTGEGDVLAV